MTPEYVIKLGQETLMLVLYVAGPTLVVALVVGLAVSIFQAVTQIHEMTLTFIPKILAVAAVVSIMLPWTMRRMIDFTTGLISSIPTIVG
ncbi:MAG: flagellar biosynthetic protein FliQ [Candidatus Latescibacterota bacterium]|jgi:flagellar biosynthetic protein FliQ|tara:strand:+ start:913 stop:1182 length:270 start_codon:yes stop_codon:yes gene_type:complete